MNAAGPVRVRFAPSPTGYLHIGGVRTALFNWLWARKNKGVFVLRIEDTDAERNKPEYHKAILDSLEWVGLDWDEGPFSQMERLPLYKEHAERLIREKKAYRCYCTKEELEAQREALKAKDPKAQFRYPGTCRDRTDQPDKSFVVRFRTPGEGVVTYTDKVFGEITTPNGAQQDFVLMRRDGIPLYNFGVVVDDLTMGITLVARGRDHMVNTPPQILLYEALGAPVPEFAHLPMMLNANGQKLSKRDGAVSVSEYRDAGYAPSAVLNYLVRFGWSHGDQEVFSKEQLTRAFSWNECGRGDGKFDPKKFLAINHDHLKNDALMPEAEYATRLLPFLEKRGLSGLTAAGVRAAIPLVRERATTFVDAADRLDFVFRADPVMDEAAASKFLVRDAAPNLRGLSAQLESMTSWSAPMIEQRVNAWLTERGMQIKDVAQPARVALTGKSASPGLFDVIATLGKSETLRRLQRAAASAEGHPGLKPGAGEER